MNCMIGNIHANIYVKDNCPDTNIIFQYEQILSAHHFNSS